jgi:signal transduction histidine kinase
VLLPAPEGEGDDPLLQHYLRTGEKRHAAVGHEVTARCKDGSTFPVDLSVSQVEHFRLLIAMLRDVTGRKRLEQELLQVAASEQRRIGADLHDQIGQELTALGLLTANLRESADEQALADPGLVEKLEQGLKRVQQQVRAVSRGLMPVEVDSYGLSAALAELAARIREGTGVHCAFQGDPAAPIHDNAKAQHLYRIAREACNNALKHGKPKKIDIRLTGPDDRIILRVTDDGVGLPERYEEGMGMRIMRDRARMIQARLSIERAKPHGTEVTCTLQKGLANGKDQGQAGDDAGADR